MSWFNNPKTPKTPVGDKQLKIPEGLWLKCENCKEILYRKELEKNLNVCMKCNYHFRLSASQRLGLIYDNGVYTEFDNNLAAIDPLKFKDSQKYRDRLKNSQENTGLKDALLNTQGKLGGYEMVICAFEFSFMGGSMASVVGEKLSRGMERAIQLKIPFMSISASGGARMQEGLFSLMQMAKTSAAVSAMGRAKIPFISLLTDPTMGGVSASFAMLGDVIIAEPGALIGFAGPRVIEQTMKKPLPEGFQRAEFLLEHGMIDMIVNRGQLRNRLVQILNFFNSQTAGYAGKDACGQCLTV
ncbi:MAG: acetyl-CoA carboxylase carboxyltransferase subunit beta [Candidatus Schekmanbacteria bacterium]|nr:acetyl-CoA carboxylase carboxyltransferase subunit beta [Candidatus Schekmanbacteria bacterium]